MPSRTSHDDLVFWCGWTNPSDAHDAADRFFGRYFEDQEVTIAQLRVLLQIDKLQPVTITNLARAIYKHRTNAARLVTVLHQRGIVRFAVSKPPRGRSARTVSLTAKGRSVMKRCAPLYKQAQSEFERRIGKRVWRETLKGLQKIRRVLNAN